MNARRAARELALLTLFQQQKQPQAIDNKGDWQDTMLSAVRSLVDEANEQLESAVVLFQQIEENLHEIELNDPENLTSHIELGLQPVKMPTTKDVREKIHQCLLASEYVAEAMRIPELTALTDQPEVQSYANRLIQTVLEHQDELDVLIGDCSDDWRIDRLVKMDVLLLRLAAAEMRYFRDVDNSVSINEAIELAKSFSTEDSFKFINGILGALDKKITDGTISPVNTTAIH